jgi:hypothetical protein
MFDWKSLRQPLAFPDLDGSISSTTHNVWPVDSDSCEFVVVLCSEVAFIATAFAIRVGPELVMLHTNSCKIVF